MGFIRSKSFLVLSVSEWTLQSIPGVNSRIYCIDQNPTPYSTPLLRGTSFSLKGPLLAKDGILSASESPVLFRGALISLSWPSIGLTANFAELVLT